MASEKEQKRILNMFLYNPIKLAHMLGFIKLTELHNYWIIKMIQTKAHWTLQAARNTYKTTCVSFALAYIMIVYPNDRTLFMRKTDDDVKEIVAQVRNILDHEITRGLIKLLWGIDLQFTVDNATELSTNLVTDNKGTSQLVARGIGSSLTGKHYDRIFTDDIVNKEDRRSKAEREKTKSVYRELINLINEKCYIVNTGTPWHKEDAFTLMPEPERYDVYADGVYNVIYNDERIAEVKKEIGLPSLFAVNYLLKHIASEDVIFENAQTGADIANIYDARECHIDAGYGGDDATAFTMCNKKSGKYYVLGKLWWKHVDDVLDTIIGIRQTYNAGVIRCERNADKGYLAKELKQKGERVSTYHEDMNKYLKIVTYLKKIWNDVIFVEGTDVDYINMILDFNENAEHDDAPDSLACIARRLWRKNESRGEDSYDNIYLQ